MIILTDKRETERQKTVEDLSLGDVIVSSPESYNNNNTYVGMIIRKFAGGIEMTVIGVMGNKTPGCVPVGQSIYVWSSDIFEVVDLEITIKRSQQ